MEISSPTPVSPVTGDSIFAAAAINEAKSDQLAETTPSSKRKRNLPGMPGKKGAKNNFSSTASVSSYGA